MSGKTAFSTGLPSIEIKLHDSLIFFFFVSCKELAKPFYENEFDFQKNKIDTDAKQRVTRKLPFQTEDLSQV